MTGIALRVQAELWCSSVQLAPQRHQAAGWLLAKLALARRSGAKELRHPGLCYCCCLHWTVLILVHANKTLRKGWTDLESAASQLSLPCWRKAITSRGGGCTCSLIEQTLWRHPTSVLLFMVAQAARVAAELWRRQRPILPIVACPLASSSPPPSLHLIRSLGLQTASTFVGSIEHLSLTHLLARSTQCVCFKISLEVHSNWHWHTTRARGAKREEREKSGRTR